MHVHGSCHCGAIRYEAEIDPGTVVLCHCTDCQQFAGAPYRAMIRPLRGTLRLTGAPTHYLKTADSGRQRVQGFCGTCGTHLYACDPGEAQANLGLRIGAIAERREFAAPARQIWCDSALPWALDLTAVPGMGKQS